jgi:hypothetical protein
MLCLLTPPAHTSQLNGILIPLDLNAMLTPHTLQYPLVSTHPSTLPCPPGANSTVQPHPDINRSDQHHD